MEFAASFTAIDFETANRRSDSACQLAAVHVRDGRIADSAMWMIRPEPLFFARTHINIHGITPEQVRQEPSFGDLWPEISGHLAGQCLVAHNASFDMGVLLACLRSHRQPVPEIQFTCTRAIARQAWPGRRRYGLKPLSDWLGVRFQHHDALEDSIACAKVLLAAGIDAEATSLPDLEKKLRLQRGTAGAWGHRSPRRRGGRKSAAARKRVEPQTAVAPPLFPPGAVAGVPAVAEQASQIDLQRLMVRAELIRPLSGRSVVISGRWKRLEQGQAKALAASLGGRCDEAVSASTDFLVVGASDSGRPGDLDWKREAIAQFPDAAEGLRVLGEEEFLSLVTGAE